MTIPDPFRFLFIGDIVGSPGLAFVRKAVPVLKEKWNLHAVVANAENATNGTGLVPREYKQLRTAGVDAITLGDHVYKKFEIADTLAKADEPIAKPANFPPASPGKCYVLSTVAGVTMAVVSVLGRTFMRPVDCPFQALDRVWEEIKDKAKIVLVDAHCEATAEKYLLAEHMKGRATAVLGTHTHVQTADEQIRSDGMAFICDVGMTGPYGGVLGRRIDRVLHTTLTFEPSTFDVASEDVRLAGVVVECDANTGRAISIRRVMLNEDDLKALPQTVKPVE